MTWGCFFSGCKCKHSTLFGAILVSRSWLMIEINVCNSRNTIGNIDGRESKVSLTLNRKFNVVYTFYVGISEFALSCAVCCVTINLINL